MMKSNMLRSSTKAHKEAAAKEKGAQPAAPVQADHLVAPHALFSGTIHLVNLGFRRKDQGGAVTALSEQDLGVLLEYLTLACPTILRYTSQYGQASATISQEILTGIVDVNSSTYNKGSLEDWVNTLAKQYSIPSTDCLCIINPPGMVDTSDSLAKGIGGYHETTSKCRYTFVNLNGTGLTLADRELFYAPSLSHEIAEMIVDPNASSNPEVCDPCAGNCGHVTLNFFMRDGSFVGSVTDADLLPNYDFYIEGIAQPAFVHKCPAPSAACGYFPEIWQRLGGAGYKDLAGASYSDGRLALFAIGSKSDAWHLDQAAVNGGWGGWESFGGHDLRSVTVAPNADGRLEMFCIGGNRELYHLWQTLPAGVWGGWQNLGGDGLQQISVVPDRDGVINVFAIRSGGECVWVKQVGPNGGWGEWTSLGGHGIKAVQAGVGLSGAVTVCIVDADNLLLASDAPQAITEWIHIAAPLVSQFVVLTGDESKLHIVGITNKGDAFHTVQTGPGTQFAGTDELGGNALQSIAAALNDDGRVEIFTVWSDSKIYHLWQRVGGGWSPWAGLGNTQDITFKEVRPLRSLEREIVAVGLLSDGTPAMIKQTAPNGGWA